MPWTRPTFVVRTLPNETADAAISLWLVRRGPLAPRRLRLETRFVYDPIPGLQPIVADTFPDGPGVQELEVPATRGPAGRRLLAAVMFDPATVASPRFVVRWQPVSAAMAEAVVAVELTEHAA